MKGTIYKNRGTINENEGTINNIGGTIYESNDSWILAVMAPHIPSVYYQEQDVRVREPGLLLVHKMIERRGEMCTM